MIGDAQAMFRGAAGDTTVHEEDGLRSTTPPATIAISFDAFGFGAAETGIHCDGGDQTYTALTTVGGEAFKAVAFLFGDGATSFRCRRGGAVELRRHVVERDRLHVAGLTDAVA
jgi:hypothetical protein